MQRKTKRRSDAFAAERRRAAPYTRPDKISASMFPLVRGLHSNPLRSRAQVRILPGALFIGINSNTLAILNRDDARPVSCGNGEKFRPFPRAAPGGRTPARKPSAAANNNDGHQAVSLP
jgi:hypothetical protein